MEREWLYGKGTSYYAENVSKSERTFCREQAVKHGFTKCLDGPMEGEGFIEHEEVNLPGRNRR